MTLELNTMTPCLNSMTRGLKSMTPCLKSMTPRLVLLVGLTILFPFKPCDTARYDDVIIMSRNTRSANSNKESHNKYGVLSSSSSASSASFSSSSSSAVVSLEDVIDSSIEDNDDYNYKDNNHNGNYNKNKSNNSNNKYIHDDINNNDSNGEDGYDDVGTKNNHVDKVFGVNNDNSDNVNSNKNNNNYHNNSESNNMDKNHNSNNRVDVVDQFLRRVDEYARNKENCTPGTTFNLGEGVVAQYGVVRFRAQAMAAVNRANFLTRIWKGDGGVGSSEGEVRMTGGGGEGSREIVTSEYFLYTAVRSMVESDADLFAAGNCYDQYQYKNYPLFCPYAYRQLDNPDQIIVKDLSVEYKYLGVDSEFFYQARLKAEQKIRGQYNITFGYNIGRYNGSSHAEMTRDESISISYEDGHWSKPYFDCRGGDIWMMTYTVPFFGYRNGQYYFKGTSGIDIDLEKVDIDQCPLPVDSSELNVFAGSDKCTRETTMCVPTPGQGFRRGSYKCVCKRGYYFPNTSLPRDQSYYSGPEVEAEYERELRMEASLYSHSFTCLPCAPGCLTCENDQPCVLALNWTFRLIIFLVSCLVMSFMPLLILFTYRYKHVKVLKAASPRLLRIILLGAFLLYCPIIVQYFEPTDIQCSLRVWLRELGFSISYGALLLKTWRISVVFQVRSAQRIRISDTDLIKRLLLIVFIFTVCLSIRMAAGRPQAVIGFSSSGLRTFQCAIDVWDYCTDVAELCLLLWGIRLCIMVRKAPSEFNESRFISWAIYNEALLSLFLNITKLFLRSPANPDLLYLVLFFHTQLTTTVTLAFLFGSKAYVVFKYRSERRPLTSAPHTGAPCGGTTTPYSPTCTIISNCAPAVAGGLEASPKFVTRSYASTGTTSTGFGVPGGGGGGGGGEGRGVVAGVGGGKTGGGGSSSRLSTALQAVMNCRRVGSSSVTDSVERDHVICLEKIEVDSNLVQDEFRRLYAQIEQLRLTNMRLYNPHLSPTNPTPASALAPAPSLDTVDDDIWSRDTPTASPRHVVCVLSDASSRETLLTASPRHVTDTSSRDGVVTSPIASRSGLVMSGEGLVRSPRRANPTSAASLQNCRQTCIRLDNFSNATSL